MPPQIYRLFISQLLVHTMQDCCPDIAFRTLAQIPMTLLFFNISSPFPFLCCLQILVHEAIKLVQLLELWEQNFAIVFLGQEGNTTQSSLPRILSVLANWFTYIPVVLREGKRRKRVLSRRVNVAHFLVAWIFYSSQCFGKSMKFSCTIANDYFC